MNRNGLSASRAPLLGSTALRTQAVLALAVGAGLLWSPAARAQCTPELDAQSGVSGTPFDVTCTGTENDQQGDGTNNFVSITVNGVIDVTSTPYYYGILARSNNAITVNGTVRGPYGIRLYDPVGDVVSNVVTVGAAGLVEAEYDAIRFDAYNDVTGNTITVAAGGTVRSDYETGIKLESDQGDIVDNDIAVAGSIEAYYSGVYLEGEYDVSGNTITVLSSGSVLAVDRDGIDLESDERDVFDNVVVVAGDVEADSNGVNLRGYYDAFGNQVTVAAGGTITVGSSGDGIDIEGVDGAVFDNVVTIAGTIDADNAGPYNYGEGVLLDADTALYDNVITVSGAIVGGSRGIRLSGTGLSTTTVTSNSIEVLAGATVESTEGDGIMLDGGAAVSGNTVTISGTLRGLGADTVGPYATYIDRALRFDNFSSGVIENNVITVNAGGLVDGGILFDNNSSGNTISNAGTIRALMVDAIGFRLGGSGNTITNLAGGSIVGGIDADATTNLLVDNRGDISGDIRFGAGSTFRQTTGSNFAGSAIGSGNTLAVLTGAGADTIALGAFTGFSSLSVTGGTWTAAGTGAGFGSTTIGGGSLILNGSLPGPVSVGAAGFLGGNGSTGALSVSGVVSPGTSPGVINVAGSLTFNAGSFYDVELDLTGPSPVADLIAATGPATLNGGQVRVSLGGSPLSSFSVPIVTASSVTGTFSSLSAPSNIFQQFSLSYLPTQVRLNVTGGSFCSVAQTANQSEICAALDAAGPGGGAYNALLGVNSAAGAQAALDSLSGAGHPSAFLAMEYVHDLFTRFAQDRLTASDAPVCFAQLASCEMRFAALDDGTRSDASYGADGELRMWGRAFGGYGFVEAVPSVAETDFRFGGLAMGIEKKLHDRVFGLGLGFSETRGDVGADHDFNIETVQFQGYAGFEAGRFDLLAVAGAGHNSVNSDRTVAVGPVSDVARANYDGWTLGVSGEVGYRLFETEKWRVTPFVGADYTRAAHEAFTELGSALGNLTVDADSVDALRAVAGLRVQSTDKGFMRTRISPALRIAYAREFLAGDVFDTAFASNPGVGFHVEGAEFGRNRLMVGLGAAVRLTENAQLGVGYDGDFSKDDQAHAATARLQVNF